MCSITELSGNTLCFQVFLCPNDLRVQLADLCFHFIYLPLKFFLLSSFTLAFSLLQLERKNKKVYKKDCLQQLINLNQRIVNKLSVFTSLSWRSLYLNDQAKEIWKKKKKWIELIQFSIELKIEVQLMFGVSDWRSFNRGVIYLYAKFNLNSNCVICVRVT